MIGIFRSLKRLMSENNDMDKPIWITEIGCPGIAAGKNMLWWEGRAQDEKEQGEFLKGAMETLLNAEGVRKYFGHFFRIPTGILIPEWIISAFFVRIFQ